MNKRPNISGFLRWSLLTAALCALPPAVQAQTVGHVGDIDLLTVMDSTLDACVKIDAFHGTGDPADVRMVLVHNSCKGDVAYAIGPWPLKIGPSDSPHTSGVVFPGSMPDGGNYKIGMVLAVCDASQADISRIDDDATEDEIKDYTGSILGTVQQCVDQVNQWHDGGGH